MPLSVLQLQAVDFLCAQTEPNALWDSTSKNLYQIPSGYQAEFEVPGPSTPTY